MRDSHADFSAICGEAHSASANQGGQRQPPYHGQRKRSTPQPQATPLQKGSTPLHKMMQRVCGVATRVQTSSMSAWFSAITRSSTSNSSSTSICTAHKQDKPCMHRIVPVSARMCLQLQQPTSFPRFCCGVFRFFCVARGGVRHDNATKNKAKKEKEKEHNKHQQRTVRSTPKAASWKRMVLLRVCCTSRLVEARLSATIASNRSAWLRFPPPPPPPPPLLQFPPPPPLPGCDPIAASARCRTARCMLVTCRRSSSQRLRSTRHCPSTAR